MIIGPRRAVLIGTIAAVALAIIFYPIITQAPIDLGRVGIDLSSVELTSGSQEEQVLHLRVTFTISNRNDITLTTSKIDYELFADGASLGTSVLSYEDVPPNGRPALFPNGSVPLSHIFTLQYSDSRAEIFNKVLNNTEEIRWSVSGTAQIESALTLVTKEFSDELSV